MNQLAHDTITQESCRVSIQSTYNHPCYEISLDTGPRNQLSHDQNEITTEERTLAMELP
jgi:hypothetical protein